MPERVENINKLSAYFSYVIGTGLVMFDGAMKFLTENAAAVGALCVVITTSFNVIIGTLNYQRKKRAQELLLAKIPASYIQQQVKSKHESRL